MPFGVLVEIIISSYPDKPFGQQTNNQLHQNLPELALIEGNQQVATNPINHFLLLCSPFVRIFRRLITISTTFLRQLKLRQKHAPFSISPSSNAVSGNFRVADTQPRQCERSLLDEPPMTPPSKTDLPIRLFDVFARNQWPCFPLVRLGEYLLDS